MQTIGRLIRIADAYEREAQLHGGRSLARISTIVVNRGSFFTSIRAGKTCTVASFDLLLGYFGEAANWPRSIPIAAIAELRDAANVTSSQQSDAHTGAGRNRTIAA